jgi:hypothetical protein
VSGGIHAPDPEKRAQDPVGRCSWATVGRVYQEVTDERSQVAHGDPPRSWCIPLSWVNVGSGPRNLGGSGCLPTTSVHRGGGEASAVVVGRLVEPAPGGGLGVGQHVPQRALVEAGDAGGVVVLDLDPAWADLDPHR